MKVPFFLSSVDSSLQLLLNIWRSSDEQMLWLLSSFCDMLATKVRLHNITFASFFAYFSYLFKFIVLGFHHPNKVSDILILAWGSASYRT